jgi:hypothetical protein
MAYKQQLYRYLMILAMLVGNMTSSVNERMTSNQALGDTSDIPPYDNTSIVMTTPDDSTSTVMTSPDDITSTVMVSPDDSTSTVMTSLKDSTSTVMTSPDDSTSIVMTSNRLVGMTATTYYDMTTDQLQGEEKRIPPLTSLDEVIFLVYLTISAIVTIVGMGLIIYVIYKNEEFHIPHFHFMVSYMAGDLLQVVSASLPAIIIIIAQIEVPLWYCDWFGNLYVIGMFSGVHMLGIIALERYFFLCQPFKHARLFTNTTSLLIIVLTMTLNIGYTVAIGQIQQREFRYSVGLCATDQNPLVSYLHWGCVALPSMFATVFATVRVFILQRRTRVAPAPDPGAQARKESTLQSTKKSLRMILFTSGLLWIVTIPAYGAITAVFRSGITWSNLESGSQMLEARIIRGAEIGLYSLTPLLNVGVHLFTHPALRAAVMRTLRDIRTSLHL